MNLAPGVFVDQELSIAPATLVQKGTGNIDFTIRPQQTFKPTRIVIHFYGSGWSGTNPITLTLDSGNGAEYDALLSTVPLKGLNADANIVWTADELRNPSPWTFNADDGIRIQWTDPSAGTAKWGIEIKLALL